MRSSTPKLIASALFTMLTAVPLHSQVIPSAATEQDGDVVAVVLGKEFTAREENSLDGRIFKALLDRFAEENRLDPTNEEIDAFIVGSEQKERQVRIKHERDGRKLQEELKSSSLSEKERKGKETHLKNLEIILKSDREMAKQSEGKEEQVREGKRQMAQHFVRTWKINRALYAKYRGRVIFQQAGPEPLDAYRGFLKEQEKKGAFRIFDKEQGASFWKYFTDDSMHVFCREEDAAKLMNTPWWLIENQDEG